MNSLNFDNLIIDPFINILDDKVDATSCRLISLGVRLVDLKDETIIMFMREWVDNTLYLTR